MKRFFIATLFIVACTQKPAPVASDTNAADPAQRPAIDVQYVAVPTMDVHARADGAAPVIATYGLTEAISILEKKGEWSLVRTFDGAGWVKSADMMTGAELDKIAAGATPRFYVAPRQIPFNARGEILLQAKVNTDGSVIDVTPVKNTTGSAALAVANADALKEAKFYPLVDKGTRKTFVYEHRVIY
ncbi:MAG TPA: SH3 domain-containing protein [Thermoanaerobaculia bacterium]|nr:SH3 domain-containing protein [Thermoanaerobaculia bacterium]